MEKLSFGEQLALLRKRRGFTQTELANRSGILREMICTYESGKVTPRIDTIKKMAKALEMDYGELYDYILQEQEGTAAVPEEEHALFRQEDGKLKLVEEVSDVVALPVLSHVHAGDPNLISDQEIIDVIKAFPCPRRRPESHFRPGNYRRD
jgi:transcriptional regulator with XRE-family HTH domain